MATERGVAERVTLRELLTVAAGGFLGTFLRGAGLFVFPPEPGGIPWATLVENLLGAFLLGVLTTSLLRLRPQARRAHLFFTTGLLGSYTTFSALALDGVILIRASTPGPAILYLGLSIFGGVALASAGIAAGRRISASELPL